MVLGQLSVSRRIFLVLAIGFVTPTFVSIQSLKTVRNSLLAARASEVKHLDEAAWTLVASYHDRAEKGLMSDDAAKDAAKSALRDMHYDGRNYFFIWDMDGVSVAHGGNPTLEGRNFIVGPDAVKCPGVSDMVKKLVRIARDEKEGLAQYQIPKAGETTALDKIGYSKLFEPWHWAIGTGAYLTDIDAFYWSQMRSDLLIVACLTIVTGLLSSLLGRDLSSSLRRLTGAVKSLAGGDLTVAIPSADRGDEVGVMARAMRVFKENAVQAALQGAELQETSVRLEAALSNMLQGLCLHGRDGRLEIFNLQFCSILGINPADIRPGMSIRNILEVSVAAGNYPGRDLENVVAERQAFIDRLETGSLLIPLAKGRLVSIMHCPMPTGGWVATYEDVTDRRAADAKIAYMARHDALTGLPNRLVLNERIEQALIEAGRGRHAALLCLDLDDFKRVNDTLGHPVGDGLLIAVSDRLRACLREVDTLARVGGDEFVVVQSGILRPEDAKLLAERIIDLIQQPFVIDGHQIITGITIGLALIPNDGTDQSTILKNADIALYRAKGDERGTLCFFEAEMDLRLQLRRQLELDMRAGLTNNEFELFYQPLVGLESKQVVGFEALIRWRHPERGMISPGEFIPVAEETGLIVPLGEWVIKQACREASSWPGTIKVAVNLSPNQFKSKNLVPTVIQSLEESGLAASRLELEVTETLLLQDNESTLRMLHELRALGTRIAMDDFGTGYSSLSYLRSFPFDKIKIDQSFVRDLSQRNDSIQIVRAIKGLCAGLGMMTTAEGVETDDQFDTICAEGCTEVQGFLFSPPRPAFEVPAMMERVRQMDIARTSSPPFRLKRTATS